jgi:UDP-glucose 4-epimerase
MWARSDRRFDIEKHVIIGGTGFIGRHVALMLARLGHEVILASRHAPPFLFPDDAAWRITWIQVDMASVDWRQLCCDCDAVHYYAWSTIPSTSNIDPEEDLHINVMPMLAMLEALRCAKRRPRVIFASSGGTVYGKLNELPASESHGLAPITAYGASKAAIELYLGYFREIHGLDCRVARMANPFGAGQNTGRGQGAVTAFVNLALAGQPISIWGDGETVRDYLHVSDAARGLTALALNVPAALASWTFNIASGRGISLNQVVAALEALLNRRLVVERTPKRAFDVPVSVLDISRAQASLGWAPRLTFAEGLRRTVNDMRRQSWFSDLQDAAILR